MSKVRAKIGKVLHLVYQSFGIIFTIFQGFFTFGSQQREQRPIDTQKDMIEYNDRKTPDDDDDCCLETNKGRGEKKD